MQDRIAAAAAAIERWLDSPQTDPALREAAAAAILDAGEPALRHFAGIVREAIAHEGDGPRERRRFLGVDGLLIQVGNGWLQREVNSQMVFDGQYAPLAVLQPHIGEHFLHLLLDPPDWFPEDQRHLLVPALRDLYPKSPGEDVVQRLERIARDEQLEMQSLRRALEFALAQWGKRELIESRIVELAQDAAPALAEPVRGAVGTGGAAAVDEHVLGALRRLSDVHYELREYAEAARLWRIYLRRSESAGMPPSPNDYYNAACNMARAGQHTAALDELERAVERMRSGTVDSSQMLERELFERDHDIAAVRRTQRFQRLLERAFGERSAVDGEGSGGGKSSGK